MNANACEITRCGLISYTSDGLVVGWKYQTRPPAAAGGPSAALAKVDGAQDESFSVSVPQTTCTHPLPYTASAPAVIQGRKVAGRVVDLFKERGVSLERLEQILKSGKKTGEGDLTIYWPDPNDGTGISWIAVEKDGFVALAGL